jgi:hypothetical protein
MNALLAGGPEHGSTIRVSVPPPIHVDVEVHEDLVEIPEGGKYPPEAYSTHRYALSTIEGYTNDPESRARYSYLHRLS